MQTRKEINKHIFLKFSMNLYFQSQRFEFISKFQRCTMFTKVTFYKTDNCMLSTFLSQGILDNLNLNSRQFLFLLFVTFL